MADLRSAGQIGGGPKPFQQRDRANFLSALDLAVVRLKRDGGEGQRWRQDDCEELAAGTILMHASAWPASIRFAKGNMNNTELAGYV